ncbi:hypothetical protein ABE562_04980 [Brucella intermedia]|uniref:Uncharacterized protein n=1 Tax=Brucella intermedia GD04153 TaxID=2975438 RepID=A0AA42GW15_9HYPH|nr:hypothetical protein [Brucella intermedia]MDH0123320.1 hypothetical protein [Brucella intermedia GD04153]
MTNISYIENVDHFEGSVVAWLTPAGREALQIENAFEINSTNGCANIEWTDVKFGDQHIEIAPGGSEDARILDYMLANPESAIENIEDRLEELKEKAAHEVTDIRRAFLDGTAALVFKLGGSETCEWLETDDHNALTSDDSMDGGSYDTLAEAEAALESVKAEFLAQCGTDEDRANLEAGEFRILW